PAAAGEVFRPGLRGGVPDASTPAGELGGGQTSFQKNHRCPPRKPTGPGGPGQVGERPGWGRGARGGRLSETAAGEGRERFRGAVGERLGDGPVAAHLSGGMDSSGVACVARDLLGAGAGKSPLHGLTMVYERPGLAGERAYAELVARQGGPLRAHYLPAD